MNKQQDHQEIADEKNIFWHKPFETGTGLEFIIELELASFDRHK